MVGLVVGCACASPSASSAYNFIHYCPFVYTTAGSSCVDGGFGGWDKNYFTYNGNPNVWGNEAAYNFQTANVDSNRDPYNVADFNSVADLCYDWYAGYNQVNLTVGNVEYSHTIEGTGRYETSGSDTCP
ncbi:MAG: hypothetical protein ACLP8S_00160 [Solirubrobacteraceae bacterium]